MSIFIKFNSALFSNPQDEHLWNKVQRPVLFSPCCSRTLGYRLFENRDFLVRQISFSPLFCIKVFSLIFSYCSLNLINRQNSKSTTDLFNIYVLLFQSPKNMLTATVKRRQKNGGEESSKIYIHYCFLEICLQILAM